MVVYMQLLKTNQSRGFQFDIAHFHRKFKLCCQEVLTFVLPCPQQVLNFICNWLSECNIILTQLKQIYYCSLSLLNIYFCIVTLSLPCHSLQVKKGLKSSNLIIYKKTRDFLKENVFYLGNFLQKHNQMFVKLMLIAFNFQSCEFWLIYSLKITI